jgi:hypothetical protein
MNCQSEWVAVEDAVQLLETTRINLMMQIKRGLLKGQEVDGVWVVERDSLLAAKQGGKVDQGKVLAAHACAKAGQCGGSCG